MWRGRTVQPDDVTAVVVVGLGNPGDQYAGSRHNIGQEAVEFLARESHVALQDVRKLKAKVATVRRDGRQWILVVPTTFMNRSGDAVQAVARVYNVPAANILVCHDDLDVELGQVRVKQGGGHAGHNGLRDIDRALGTAEYCRVRLGIGRPPGRMDPSKFVLGRFRADERPIVDAVVAGTFDVLDALVRDGVDATQNRFHGRTL
jgi:peptidyl-tRNA hydrolase, PTH1 family